MSFNLSSFSKVKKILKGILDHIAHRQIIQVFTVLAREKRKANCTPDGWLVLPVRFGTLTDIKLPRLPSGDASV